MTLTKNVAPLILFASGVSINLFFGVISVLGYEYSGSAESPAYLLYSVILGAATFVIFFRECLVGRISLKKSDHLLILVPLFFVFSFLISSIFDGGAISPASQKYFLGFFLWSMPAFCAGFYFSRLGKMDFFRRMALALCFFLFISSATYLFATTVQGGGNEGEVLLLYQTASYQSAFSLGLALFFVTSASRGELTGLVRVCLICMIPILFVTSLSAGGRGGVLLCLIYLLFVPLFIMRRRARINYLALMAFLFCFFLLFGNVAIGYLLGSESFERGLERVFLPFQGGQINWEGTGRNEVYYDAIEEFVSSPWIGRGAFGYYANFDYPPHNIVLEILLGFGLLGLFIWIPFSLAILKKAKSIALKNDERIALIFGVYALVQLMFSATYLVQPEFWFFIGFCLGFNRLRREGLGVEAKLVGGELR